MSNQVASSLSIKRLCGLLSFKYELSQETIKIYDRRYLKVLEVEMSIDSLPTEYSIISNVSKGGMVAAGVPLAFALLFFVTLSKGGDGARQDALAVGGVFVLCSLPGIIYSILRWERFIIMNGDGARMVFPYIEKRKDEINSFIDDIHQAKIRLISRRINLISSLQMVDDMYRRLSYYLDKRIIRQKDYEEFIPIVNNIKIRVGG